MQKLRTALAIALLGMGGAAIAAPPTISVNSPTAAPGASADVVLTFTNSTAPDPLSAGWQIRLTFDSTKLTPGAISTTLAGIVCNPGGAGVLNCGGFSAMGDFPASGTVTIPMTVAMAATGTSPLALDNHQQFDGIGNDIPGTNANPADGVFTIQAGPGNVPPNLTYNPNFGTNVVFPGAGGQLLNATIAVSGAGGSGSGLDATARVTNCQVSPPFSPPVFTCSAGAGGTLDFTPGGADPGDINCSCQAPVIGTESATLTCDEIRPASGSPVVRTWNLTCPGTAGQCGVLAFTPPEGVVNFSAGAASIVVSHSGGTSGADTSFNNCVIGGANAGNFSITNTPIAFNFPGGATNQGTISLACTNSTTTDITASLSCNQICDGTTARNWTLSCPGQTAPPVEEEAVPVPTLGDFGRILLAAMLLLLGMGAVTIRTRG